MRIDLPLGWRTPEKVAFLFGTNVCRVGNPRGEITGIATHSAEVRPGDLFLCLSGKRQSGVAFIDEALHRGAIAILAPTFAEPSANCFFLPCENAELALLGAAAVYRKEIGARVIAVTGSAGKTTVKEAIAAVLGNVPHSEANYNSLVGMPLSVLSLPRAAYWVLELGINARGEMRKMASALSPDVAVITNVGSAHIGGLGDFATILEEKLEIVRALSPRGTLILPTGIPVAGFVRSDCRVVRVGTEMQADARLENVRMSEEGVCLDLAFGERRLCDIAWPIPGRIGSSVLGIVGVLGLLEKCKDEQIREGLRLAGEHTPRMRRRPVGDKLLLDDTYNASPEAMIASLEVLKLLSAKRPTVAVLGDMCELGTYAPSLHDAIGVFVAQSGISKLFTYGEEAMAIACGALRSGMERRSVFSYRREERERLVQDLAMNLPLGAVVLFKGSRRMAMDEIVKRVGG